MKLHFLRQAVLALGLLVLATAANAQATRTWVSGVGDDANPCSRTAPCKTFAGAISKTAAKGYINCIDSGGFGAVTITKSITIDCAAAQGGILASGSNGVIVNAAATDIVRLRNLSIEGIGTGLNGVRFLAGGALYIENTNIFGFTQNGVEFVPAATSRLVIADTSISNNTLSGVHTLPGVSGFARVSIENVRVYENGQGMKFEDRSTAAVRDSLISSNVNSGVNVFSTSQAVEATVDHCQVTNNGPTNASSAGIKSQGNLASVVISDNVITGNSNGLSTTGGADIFSFGSNRVTDNDVDGTPTGTLTTR